MLRKTIVSTHSHPSSLSWFFFVALYLQFLAKPAFHFRTGVLCLVILARRTALAIVEHNVYNQQCALSMLPQEQRANAGTRTRTELKRHIYIYQVTQGLDPGIIEF